MLTDLYIEVNDIDFCQAFESSSWSERNAALQLFGALAPRILGQGS